MHIFRVICEEPIKNVDFFVEKLLLSIANNSKNISFTKKMYRIFFYLELRFLSIPAVKIYLKNSTSEMGGGNHPQGTSARRHDIDFDPRAIPYLL